MVLRLKEIRILRGLTQQQVADFLGCSQPDYSRYEKGARQAPYEIILQLADYYQVSVDYLLGRDLVEDGLSEYEKALVFTSRKLPEIAREEHLSLMQLRAGIAESHKE